MKKKKKILVLGGGGARGLCHIGFLRWVEKHYKSFPFDAIIGTSMGALIATSYASGTSLEDIETFLRSFQARKLLKIKFSATGILNTVHFDKAIAQLVSEGPYKCDTYITTVNIITGESVYFYTLKGNKCQWRDLIRASCSIPGTLPAVQHNKMLLVDGGLKNNIPAKMARTIFPNCKIVAVDPGYVITDKKPKNLIAAMWKALQITEEELNRYQSEYANIVIKPELKNITQFQFHKAKEIIEEGEKSTQKKWFKLKRMLK